MTYRQAAATKMLLLHGDHSVEQLVPGSYYVHHLNSEMLTNHVIQESDTVDRKLQNLWVAYSNYRKATVRQSAQRVVQKQNQAVDMLPSDLSKSHEEQDL